MGFWGLVKETYKGSKQLIKEVNHGLEVVGCELEKWNDKQEKIRPAREVIHAMRMNKFTLDRLALMIPAEYEHSHRLLNVSSSYFDKLIEIAEVAKDEANKSQDYVLSICELLIEQDSLRLPEEEVMLEHSYSKRYLESKGLGFQANTKKNAEYRLSEMIVFAYQIEGEKLENEAIEELSSIQNSSVGLNKCIMRINELDGRRLSLL
ncbi:hypothetical protein AB4341_17720 [Vibrio breoganii]